MTVKIKSVLTVKGITSRCEKREQHNVPTVKLDFKCHPIDQPSFPDFQRANMELEYGELLVQVFDLKDEEIEATRMFLKNDVVMSALKHCGPLCSCCESIAS